jgi:NADPH:quinone reductase-like Zn-dependent oxidoreductase
MRAAVYGRHVEVRDVEKPVPADDEVLIAVHAASINALDWGLASHPLLRRLMLARSKRKPVGPGRDVAGVIEAVGKNVTQFRVGDAVLGIGRWSFAEYVCAAESALVKKPERVTFDHAACVPLAGLTALQAVRDAAGLQRGEKVLINGAAGGVGTLTVQIAKSNGGEVTAVCSGRNVEMVRSIGAERAIDYTKDDFTKEPYRYDVIFDVAGSRPLFACRRLLTENGRFVMVGGPKNALRMAQRVLSAFAFSRFDKRFRISSTRVRQDDLAVLAGMMQDGQLKPVIERTYNLDEVAEALQYIGEGHARAKVVIKPRYD